ncbi:hypothetical protein [Prochlorococcus marinus]|uniref:hypothetical protein n=1 Tax=Prochlorococcus marinus TaxID=1219 RepID=UPI0007B3CD38|nr:hypothetical protein [Prochlorococcus marinus]KZR73260.1 hypothetical protein PMIT1320_01851 [Prochlorococcus marinus str. MIT 1320]
MSSITILILAGGTLSGRKIGPAENLNKDPRWLPAGSRLAIDRIFNFYRSKDKKANVLLVHDMDDGNSSSLPERTCPGLNQLSIPAQNCIGNTLSEVLKFIKSKWVVINPVTTLPILMPKAITSIQIGDKPLQQENWSSFIQGLDGDWHPLAKKYADPFSPPSWPFTGIVTAKRDQLIDLLNHSSIEQRKDLIEIISPLLLGKECEIIKVPWKDLGHRATYALAMRNELSSRSFNQVQYCHKRDLIIKQSNDTKRLEEEREYLKELPERLKQYFPLLLNANAEISKGSESLVMEALPFPTLAELFLHWDIGTNCWISIFQRLKYIQDIFKGVYPTVYGSASWLYSKKLKHRMQLLEQSATGPLRYWLDHDFNINGYSLPSLNRTISELIPQLENIENHCSLQMIHGDFCFNNILCDPLTATVKLIDPRGENINSLNTKRGIGDYRYDIIKLNHSIEGLYDSTANNLFSLRHEGKDSSSLSIYKPSYHSFLEKTCKELFFISIPSNDRQILTASLFLSMLPLHSDDHYRQFALASTGALIMEDKFSTVYL